MSDKDHYTVVIVGAGPVGLLIALRLGQNGVKTLVLERHHTLLPTTRATVYQPVVLEALKELGILEKVKQNSYLNSAGITWFTPSGERLGHLPLGAEGKDDEGSTSEEFQGVLLIGQNKMNHLILQELQKYPSVEVRFGHHLVGLEQSESEVTLLIHESSPTHHDDSLIMADYVVGSDGANSTVRRALCIPFEGFSFTTFTMIGADVWYDFSKGAGYDVMNFVVDPQLWGVIIYTGQDRNGDPYGNDTPLWRVAYIEPSDLPDGKDDILQRARNRISDYSKGARDFEISRAEKYTLHQRAAAQASKGRVFLAGDALHSNNPIGGLGLTTGIIDAWAYGNALIHVLSRHEDASLLEKCANSRRNAWLNTTNVVSLQNLKRLNSTAAEDILEREEFFRKLREEPGFPDKAKAKIDEMAAEIFSLEA